MPGGISAYEACIKACQECILTCEECLDSMMFEQSHNDCPRCCRECLAICQLCVGAMARDSRYVKRYCGICAEISEWCAEQCAEHEHDHCRRCAEACRRCAAECRNVAA